GRVDAGESPKWVDFDLYGHQFVIHETGGSANDRDGAGSNPVDGDAVPVPHCGAVLEIPQFEALAKRLTTAGVAFVIPPRTRFAGQPGEQRTMFFLDPSGNALEFKAFADIDGQLFAT
ncbi:MAG: VOC family protein, partial [Planctomycetota bacterium]